ncbi:MULTISPECIES: imm11 family protein [Myxococcus]|uniref:imm11 family protein n=1 Tax=Myxococcus TaxID=32 RepID=UPI003084675A
MTATPSYAILQARTDLEDCVIDQFPRDLACIWQPTEGVPARGLYPAALDFHMSRRMGGKGVTDCLRNTLGYLFVSARFRQVLESSAGVDIEYLPIRLINHKGRREPGEFFVANVLGALDCMDMRRSEYEPSALRKGEVFGLRKLELDMSRIEPSRNLFRLTTMPRLIIARWELVQAMELAGLAGVSVSPVGTPVDL